MGISKPKPGAETKVRLPYAAPSVAVLMDHKETRALGGVGFDGDITVNMNRS